VEKSGTEKVTGTLKITVPVKVPDDFLALELKPAAPKAEEKATADTTFKEPRFYQSESKFHYKWTGTNCQVEDVDRLTTSVTAPKSGEAKVSVELFIEDSDGKRTSLISKQVSFNVDGKPTGTPSDKPKDDKGDKKDGQQTPVQVQPGSYTQGQIGVDGGIKGQTGVTPGTPGQTGTPGQPETGTKDQPVTGVKGETGVTGQDTTGQKDGGVKGTVGITSGQVGIDNKKPPPCTYKYSGWGECNRTTKKWTRTVIGLEPLGCTETGKPVLEDGCTPPPTEEEKRNNYLNCLCRCYTHWAGHIGVFYSPTGYQDCGGSGPCVGGIGAFGNCDRSFFGSPNDCAKGCYEGAYGKGSYDEKTADKIRKEVNNKFKKPLKLKVNEGKCPIKAQMGEIITLTATAEGGIPPHKYSWSGNGQAKDNTFTFANSRQPGPHPISVTVTDDDGGSATASCTIIVEAMTVKIELLDKENKIPIGESRNFKGTVMSGDQPAKGDFYFLWQPHPEIAFSPFEKTGGNISGTKATFKKMGKFKVWVIAHTYKDKVKTTIGESEQIEIEVAKPELKLSYQPPNPKVGQEVKLTVTDKPKMDDKTISFWWEISGNTLNAGPLKNEREYTFRPKDIKPVTVTVHGKAKDGGDDLGEDKATITAQAYEVKLGEPHHLPPKPRIWKCDTQLGKAKDCGIVELEKELAVFNDIFIKASVTPEPEKPPLKYSWSITPEGSCGLPGAGQELKINCSQPGSYTVTVKMRDSQNVELGTASTQVGITITKDDLDKGKKHLVTLQADKTALKTGETANIKATVKGGKTPYTYKWSEGVEGKGESAKFIPKKSGDQKISVEVTDSTGQKSSAMLDIKVDAGKLEVALSADKTALKVGESAIIKAGLKGGEPAYSYKWSEGVDGKNDLARFIPKKSGAQKISLEVTDSKGIKASATVDIKVEAPKLEASLKADKTTFKIGETANIKAEVKGGEPAYTYKWSDGLVGKGESATFTPKKAGSQKITLEVTDSAKQKSSASLDLNIEAPKLEVVLTIDKPSPKTGETASIKAAIKGGKEPYTYSWSNQVEGKGGSVSFSPKTSGFYKIFVEVRDADSKKTVANLDVTVQEGKGDGKPSETKGLDTKTSATKAGESKTIGQKDSGLQEGGLAAKQVIEPGNLKLAPGESGVLRAFEVDKTGKKTEIPSSKVSWKVDPYRGASIDQTGKVSLDKSARPGTSITVNALFEKSQASSTLEIIPASTSASISSVKESGSKETKGAKMIQPDPLQLSPGGSGLISFLEKDIQGRTAPPSDSRKLIWKLEPSRKDLTLKPQKDGLAVITANSSIKVGTKVKVLATLDKSQVSGTIEIISAQIVDKGKETDPALIEN
ncbi:MAG: hypothetical protein C0407_07700, partial [Desulfobacca sp.]|nr:hypothetical protein [Desulfobacca sp.]